MYRAAAGAAGFAVVVGAVGVLVGAEDVGVAMVAGIEILFAQPVQVGLHLVGGAHRIGEGEEFAAFLFVKPLGGASEGAVGIVEHVQFL